MSVPERSDGEMTGPDVSGDHNQIIKSVADNGKVVGPVVGDVTFNETKVEQAREPVTWQFQLKAVPGFVGRKAELAEIGAVLKGDGRGEGSLPIVAISGMAGVGKSALAIRGAQLAVKAGLFPDGQLYENLMGAGQGALDGALGGAAARRDPFDVLGDWLRAVGMDGKEIPRTLVEREKCFRSWAARRRVLIVLDNAGDEEQVRPLLPGGAGCAVLVTSRQALGALAGTHDMPLGMLPEGDAVALLDTLAGKDLQGDSRVQKERAAAEEIVRLCGYLPLAVRIAGGVLKGKRHWGLAADYLPKLRDRRQRLGQLKQAGGEDVQASFDLSYAQLSELDRRLFAVLGAIPADFGLLLAAAVSEGVASRGAGKESEVAVGIERLIDAQLVEVPLMENAATRRYRYHDLMRLYAQAKLAAGEQAAADERAFDWYWNAAGYFDYAFSPKWRQEMAAQREGEGTAEEKEMAVLQGALRWFEDERTHLIAAFEWGYEQQKYEKTISFAANLGQFFMARSYWQDWEETHLLALEAARKSENKKGEGQTLNNLGVVYRSQGRWEEAIAQYEQSLEIYRSLGDRHGEGQTLNNLGVVYHSQGRWEEAIAQYEQSLEIFRSLGDRHGEGQTLNNLGWSINRRAVGRRRSRNTSKA